MMYEFMSIGEKLSGLIEGAFSVNLFEFVVNILATIVLILIVRFLFWNKVTSFLEGKKEKIKNDYKETEEIKKEAEEIKLEADETLKKAKKEAKEIISRSEEEALKEKALVIEKANQEAKGIVESSKADALYEKEKILSEAKGEVVDLASLMAKKMIDETVDVDKYNDKVLDELEK